MKTYQTRDADQIFEYVITETGEPTSLDPLDADQTSNLPIARMLYLTPIEVSHDGKLESTILSSFEYNQVEKKMTWIVRDGIQFHDGTLISVDDVLFAVLRMAHERPKFPVIENIKGLTEWNRNPDALKTLPAGISKSGNTINISFNQSVEHPLFRFCLEIFGIIPKATVDIKTNKLVKVPINSGHYRLLNKKDGLWSFESFRPEINGRGIPRHINISYLSPSAVMENISEDNFVRVIHGNELTFKKDDIKYFETQGEKRSLPSARIVYLSLNPTLPPFDNELCRLIFAETFRESFHDLFGDVLKADSSFFANILPGYLGASKLTQSSLSMHSNEKISACKRRLQKMILNWSAYKQPHASIIKKTLLEAMKRLGIKDQNEIVPKSNETIRSLFMGGKVHLFSGSTGFWALDPGGDALMLFTPNLHPGLNYISEDTELQKLLRKLTDQGVSRPAYEDVNMYIHKKALFNVFAHSRRFYFSIKKNVIAEIPISITSPAPWQVFRQ